MLLGFILLFAQNEDGNGANEHEEQEDQELHNGDPHDF
jgi:hypothetical protein